MDMISRLTNTAAVLLLIVLLLAPAPAQPKIFGGHVPQAGQSGVDLRGIDLYGLDADNTLWLKRACEPDFRRQFVIKTLFAGEAVIGIDFRPSDGQLYALTDKGNLYQVDVTPPGRGNVVLVSALNPRFAGGYQSLMDFNPVLDALRLIGTDDSNFAVLNSNGNLNLTVLQTRISYAAGDPNAGADPNLCGGAYTNNQPGARVTLFYGLDYDRDVLVTIAPGANGSSATGGGQLATVGRLLRFDGNPINITPTADVDIYTDPVTGRNLLIGVSGRVLFTLDLAAVTPGQDVTVRSVNLQDGGLIDIAARAASGTCKDKDKED